MKYSLSTGVAIVAVGLAMLPLGGLNMYSKSKSQSPNARMPNVALATFLMVFELNQAIWHTHYMYACWPRLVGCHSPDERFWESVLETPLNAFTLWLDFNGFMSDLRGNNPSWYWRIGTTANFFSHFGAIVFWLMFWTFDRSTNYDEVDEVVYLLGGLWKEETIMYGWEPAFRLMLCFQSWYHVSMVVHWLRVMKDQVDIPPVMAKHWISGLKQTMVHLNVVGVTFSSLWRSSQELEIGPPREEVNARKMFRQ